MRLNGIGHGPLSNMLPVSEFGDISKQFWASGSPLENRSNSIYLLGYEGIVLTFYEC